MLVENTPSSFFQKLLPKDILAGVVLIGGFSLLYFGIDHVVGGAVIAVTTYYFVNVKKNDKSQINKSC